MRTLFIIIVTMLLTAAALAGYKLGYVDKFMEMVNPPKKEAPKDLTPEEARKEEEKVAEEVAKAQKEAEKAEKPLNEVLKETNMEDPIAAIKLRKRIARETELQKTATEKKLEEESEEEIRKRRLSSSIDKWIERVE